MSTIWRDRLKVIFRTMRYREAWQLSPRQSLGMLSYLFRSRPTWRGGEAELNLYSPPVGGPGYARYLQGLRRMGRGDWVPLVAHVAVTDRCPYRCARCSNIACSDREPPLESLVRLADDLRAAGTCRVALTGGEPLLRDDLPAVVEACGRDLSPVLFTSGHGLDSPRAAELRRAGLAAAFISLDHFLAQEHDRVRGQPGAWQRAVEAIRACREAGLYTAAQAVVGPSLLAEGRLEQFFTFCAGLEIDELMLLEELRIGGPDLETTDEVRSRLAAAHLRAAGDPSLLKVSSMSWLESPECLGCQAGFSFVYVTAGGELCPCDFVPVSFGNVYDEDLAEIHARMVHALKRPSSACLARRLGAIYRGEEGWPLPWAAAQAILGDYDPGPPPKLLQSFCHACTRPA